VRRTTFVSFPASLDRFKGAVEQFGRGDFTGRSPRRVLLELPTLCLATLDPGVRFSQEQRQSCEKFIDLLKRTPVENLPCCSPQCLIDLHERGARDSAAWLVTGAPAFDLFNGATEISPWSARLKGAQPMHETADLPSIKASDAERR
jgi:hypothetical protein